MVQIAERKKLYLLLIDQKQHTTLHNEGVFSRFQFFFIAIFNGFQFFKNCFQSFQLISHVFNSLEQFFNGFQKIEPYQLFSTVFKCFQTFQPFSCVFTCFQRFLSISAVSTILTVSKNIFNHVLTAFNHFVSVILSAQTEIFSVS